MTGTFVRTLGVAACGLMVLPVAARAQTAAPAEVAAPASHWEFSVTPYLWISGIGGTAKTSRPNSSTQTVDASFGTILSHLDGVPAMISGQVRYDRFSLSADFMAISVKAPITTRDVLFDGGSARLTQFIGTAVGAYRVVSTPVQTLDLGIGVRAFGVTTKFQVNAGLLPGFSVTPGGSWADPLAAARYHIAFGRGWGATVYGDIGGGPNSDFTWQALGTIDYQLNKWISLRIGYRHLQFEHDGNRLNQDMNMSGPILGATFVF